MTQERALMLTRPSVRLVPVFSIFTLSPPTTGMSSPTCARRIRALRVAGDTGRGSVW